MRDGTNYRQWFFTSWSVPCLALVWWASAVAGVDAQVASPSSTRVEEDWELVVNQPDTNKNGPQVTCSISPLNSNTAYGAFDINYKTQPGYSPGGLQVHAWDPYVPIATHNLPVTGLLATPDETIRWTMRMYLRSGWLKFRVVNGQSQTWGAFASTRSAAIPTQFTNLDGYDPSVSVAHSGVSFASNLVTSLTLKAVRWYDASGTMILEVTTPQVVYPKP